MVIAMTMSTPPIVGVPALGRWLFGPSSRTFCPTPRPRSLAITGGPSASAIRSAVASAYAERKVMYRKTLNGANCSWSG